MQDGKKTKRELTDAFLRTVQVEKRTDFSDTRVEGLQVRVSTNGAKTFSVRATDPSGKQHRVKIGHHPGTSLKAAREAARQRILEIHAGQDPNAEKKRAKSARTMEPILDEILTEYEEVASARGTKIWQKSATGRAPQALRVIHCVFGQLGKRRVGQISESDIASTMKSYKRIGRTGSAPTANGQAARARSYLMPVMDWAAGRGKFKKVGAGRAPTVSTPDLHNVFDPAADDPTIAGRRDRVLDGDEIRRILPLLKYPAPDTLSVKLKPEEDFRPISLRFILLTAPRRGEIEEMLWKHVDLAAGIWVKPRVKSPNSTAPRQHVIHLSTEALALLKSLPAHHRENPENYVFPNSNGGKLDNWPRITKSIQKASGTAGWNRHDLRRTASTLLRLLSTDPHLIARVLGHLTAQRDDPARTALEHYIKEAKLIPNIEDPMKTALDRLAGLMASLEAM
ncbi:MAG: integrase family protein [Paracoccaceae bacterium]|nr:integrase family protein [Paracoccaceae bacterium]